MLRDVNGSGGAMTEYRYYADGTRAEKSTTGNLTSQFYYMGGLGYLDAEDTEFAANQEIAEYDGPTLLRRYYRLPGSVDEAFLMVDLTLPANDNERWAHPNRLGSTVVVTNNVGAATQVYTYSPYGMSGEGDGDYPFRFTGQKLDPETGLYYYKARYYSPELGRFLQTDPIGYADQMNLYAYVGNDPINATDPTGEEFTFIGGAGVQGDYLDDFQTQFTNAGIENVLVPRADETSLFNLIPDVLGVTLVNDLDFASSLTGSSEISAIAAHSLELAASGEQFNLGGYSYGAAAAASVAYAVAESGGQVDNLVLLGGPINQDLFDAINSHANIANVINIELTAQNDPIFAGMSDLQIVRSLPTLIRQMPVNEGHFYYSGPNAQGSQRRSALAQELVRRGLK